MKPSATPGRAEKAQLFRDAAKRMEEGRVSCGCCQAITHAGGRGYLPEGEHGKMMLEVYPEGMEGEWGNYGENEARILALCFMAAMVETGDA